MKKHVFLFVLAFMIAGISYAQDLQTVTNNGNSTTNNLEVDPGADFFRYLAIKRLIDASGKKSQVAIANNKSVGQITWYPDLSATPSYALNIGANQLVYMNNGTTETIWRSGNMGPNSGLNADMLDGLHAASMFRYANTLFGDVHTYNYTAPGVYFNGQFRPANGVPNNNYAAYFYLGPLTTDRTYEGIIAMGTNSGSLYTKRKVANNWETEWRTIWDSGNFNPADYLALTGGVLSGDLTVGTTASQKQLNVNGNIKARRIKVSQTEWPDYVFDDSYSLPSLPSVEKFIRENKHLPGIPSADSVLTHGLDIGEQQAGLLKKVEELTLYIIEQKKEIDRERSRNEMLEKRLKAVEQLLAEPSGK